MSLINDVLQQIDARAPVAEPERIIIEPLAYSDAARKLFTLSPRVKIFCLVLAGFLSGYGSLALFEWQEASSNSLNNSIYVPDVTAPHISHPNEPVVSSALINSPAQEISITGQLTAVQAAEPKAAQLDESPMLLQAKQYFLADRLTYPPMHNAYQIYRELLIKDPTNPAALEGVASIKQRYLTLTAEAINQGAREKAQRYIERAEFVGVDAEELNQLRGQLQILMASAVAVSPAVNPADISVDEKNSPPVNEFMPSTSVDQPKTLNEGAFTQRSLSASNRAAMPANEQAFLAGLIEDKDSERLALDFIKSQGNAVETVRWLARRWVSAQQWLPLLDLMNTPSAINAAERDVFRAQALLGLKNYQELIAWLNGGNGYEQPELQRILAVALQKTGREADALIIYQQLVARHPDNSGLWLALGLSADGLGNNAMAREAFFRAQQLGGHSKTVSDFLAKKLTAPVR